MAFADLDRLLSLLRCPTCRTPVRLPKGMRCLVCRRQIFMAGQSAVFRSKDMRADDLKPAWGMSNPYQLPALELIDRYPNGIVVDLGAGAPRFGFPNVVEVEIRRYASTDVVVGEGRLPFASASVDAVISQAVLEHVKDPARYVREIYRVLKPGGRCLLDSAFLQPLHGAPGHYFNTTHYALKLLFRDFDVQSLEVAPHQHPQAEVELAAGFEVLATKPTSRRSRLSRLAARVLRK